MFLCLVVKEEELVVSIGLWRCGFLGFVVVVMVSMCVVIGRFWFVSVVLVMIFCFLIVFGVDVDSFLWYVDVGLRVDVDVLILFKEEL